MWGIQAAEGSVASEVVAGRTLSASGGPLGASEAGLGDAPAATGRVVEDRWPAGVRSPNAVRVDPVATAPNWLAFAADSSWPSSAARGAGRTTSSDRTAGEYTRR